MRLLTRSDFDGLICAVLFKEIGLLDEWKFVHPKDVQDGKVEVSEGDILANVPYAPGAGMWFDHHSSEEERINFDFEFKGASKPYPSCARVIWEYFGGHDKFPKKFDTMMEMVDKCDSGDFTKEDIDNPTGWVLLSFVMDPRTGLGRYKDYRIPNYQLMEELIEMCRTMSIEEILENPDVKERTNRYFEQEKEFEAMLAAHSRVEGNCVVIDLRELDEIKTGNRFAIYKMYPQCNISIQVIWGLNKQNTVFTVGKSVLDRSSKTDVGSLMLKYGGGGHRAVGTCQVDNDKAEAALKEIIATINADG